MDRDPYEVLGISPDATPEMVRERYLVLVREFPPEKAPQEFAAIRTAYDQLRDPVETMRRQLFDVRTTTTLSSLLNEERQRAKERRVPTDLLLSLGES